MVTGGDLDAGDDRRDGRQQAALEGGGEVGAQGGGPLGIAAGDVGLGAGLHGVGQKTLPFVVGDARSAMSATTPTNPDTAPW